ncbi:outer dynein arm-docking complex subunit 4-like [Haliotis asinina]|uniref:outer dynein arm-docking complex subunit 4-like n=1 Tax=Haliotis asinina TaxID=109174 RepID=UPI0035323EDA
MSHEPDEETSVAMETDCHGAGASINLFLASEASVTSMGGSTLHYFAQELEVIEKLFTQGRFTDCSDRAEACLADVEAASEREITQKWDLLATLHSYIGNAAACRGKYSKAEFHHAKDLEIGELEDMPEVSSRALGNLGRMYCTRRKYNKALDVLARKAPLCTTPPEVAWVFLDIGTCFMALGYHDYARDCGKKVLSVTRHSDLHDEVFQAQLLVASSEGE